MKKLCILILALILTVGFLSVTATGAFAASDEENGIDVSLETDKESYGADESVGVTVTVTNENDFPVKGIRAKFVLPGGMEQVGETDSSAIDLESGESYSRHYTVKKTAVAAEEEKNGRLWLFIGIGAASAAALGAGAFFAVRAVRKKKKSAPVTEAVCLLLCCATVFTALPFFGSAAQKESSAYLTVCEDASVGGRSYRFTVRAEWMGVLDPRIEEIFGSSPDEEDTDGDGLPDYTEILYTDTDPTVADTDGNGVNDADEDLDGDGLSNLDELKYRTRPDVADTDIDGLSDCDEVFEYSTDPTLYDTDGDGIPDGDEVLLGLNPKKASSGGTRDSERMIEQTLGEENIDAALLSETSGAVPSLTASVAGNINKSVAIRQTEREGFGGSRAVCGSAVDVISGNLKDATLSFRMDGSSPSTFDGSDLPTKMICKYTEDGKTEYLESTYDRATDTVSAEIDGEGCYFVLDVRALFDELGLELPTVTDVPVDERGKDPTETEDEERFYYAPAPGYASPVRDAVKVMGQADVVFIIDTTGSMSDEIRNVRNNVSAFAEALIRKGVFAGFALVEYRDIGDDGLGSTVVHKNGYSNWFYDVELYKEAVGGLSASGGGDNPESAVDALETARLLDMRTSAGKIFILVTDASYHDYNRYGIPDMETEIALLKNAEVNCSVVSTASEQNTYKALYEETGGIFCNINGDFSAQLLEIAEHIGSEVVGKGYWIYLRGPVPTAVRLDEEPYKGSEADTDGDGIPDVEELGGWEPDDRVDLDELLTKVSRGVITGTDYGMIDVFTYKTSPVAPDSDYDGIDDSADTKPLNNSFTGKILSKDVDKKYGNISFTVDYRDFFKPFNEYRPTLSVLSSLFATDVYFNAGSDKPTAVTVDGMLETRKNREELPTLFGMKDVEVLLVGYEDHDRTEIVVGHHAVEYNGRVREVILVAVRGTNSTFAEWSGNFDVGADSNAYYTLSGFERNDPLWANKENHKGFDVTANRALNAIEKYLSRHSETIRSDAQPVYWVTGHSRGAGIANLIGAYYTDSGNQCVTYTFASPASTAASESVRRKYGTIFNVINGDDLIPTLPLESWGFGRYGKDMVGNLGSYSGTATPWGTYTGGTFREVVGKNYNNNTKVAALLEAFGKVADDRYDVYVFSYDDDTLELYGVNSISETDAREYAESVRQDLIDKGVGEIAKYGEFDAIEGTDLFGVTKYRPGCYQTAAYLMHSLADLAANNLDGLHEVAGHYEQARNKFVEVYLSGMTHPHLQITYYLLAAGACPLYER